MTGRLLDYLGGKTRQVLKLRIEVIGVILDVLQPWESCESPPEMELVKERKKLMQNSRNTKGNIKVMMSFTQHKWVLGKDD